jgi:hypothetical protein
MGGEGYARQIIEGRGARAGLGLPPMQSFISGEGAVITLYFLTR